MLSGCKVTTKQMNYKIKEPFIFTSITHFLLIISKLIATPGTVSRQHGRMAWHNSMRRTNSQIVSRQGWAPVFLSPGKCRSKCSNRSGKDTADTFRMCRKWCFWHQEACFFTPKGGFSPSETPPFALPDAAFRITKSHVSQYNIRFYGTFYCTKQRSQRIIHWYRRN